MKKKIECELTNISTVENITPENYILFKRMEKMEKHPKLKCALWYILAFIFGWSIFDPLFCVLEANDYSDEYNQNRELLKQYKMIKKTNQWERISALMKEYENSENFGKISKELTTTYLTKKVESLENESKVSAEAEEVKQANIRKNISELDLIIEKLNAGEDLQSALESTNYSYLTQENLVLTLTKKLEEEKRYSSSTTTTPSANEQQEATADEDDCSIVTP